MPEYRQGQTVELTSDAQGVIKYVGPIHVAEGVWFGIELPTPAGKNDGSVRGERYFTCKPMHGLFVRDISIARVISQPPAPKAAAPKTRPAAAASSTTAAAGSSATGPPNTRPRPSSVIAPKAAPRVSTINKRQSVAPSSSNYTSLRAPARQVSTASSSTSAPSEPATRPAPSASRPSISSSTTNNSARASRDSNIETLQTKIRHLEKQHAEDQERLREFSQTKDDRDRYRKILDKLQTKCQVQHTEVQELKEKLKDLQAENERLAKGDQEHEVDLEDALLDKEMAEERAEQAEAEIEILRKRLEERELELDILREEAELYTTEMSEEQKQDVGYYRLQHENDRLRDALIGLKEMTEEKEQDLKARVGSLEKDLSQLEAYEQENSTLQQRVTEAEAIIEDFRQRLDAANEWEDMIGELSTQNQDFQDRIAEQDLAIQDLENLRELNDELEAQHMEQEEEMRAELEAKDIELAEQAKHITEQVAVIADNETLISKFRDLVIDLQARATDAESSKTMTEAVVKDTTGRFNEVMDINRQLRTATVQSTTREIDAALSGLKANELSKQLAIWNETESKDFAKSEPLLAYFTAKRIASKAHLLATLLVSTCRQMSNGGRLEDFLTLLIAQESIGHLGCLHENGERLFLAIEGCTLAQFAIFGPAFPELVTIEQVIDQALDALKADAVNFDEVVGSLKRSTKTFEAVLANHQQVLSGRPELGLRSHAINFKNRLQNIVYMCDVVFEAIEKVPASILEECGDIAEHFKQPTAIAEGALATAKKYKRTLAALRDDGMYPLFGDEFAHEQMVSHNDWLVEFIADLATFGRRLIADVIESANFSEADPSDAHRIEMIKTFLKLRDQSQQWSFSLSGITTLSGRLVNWTDHASLLLNNVEIECGPTPWAQKAKEVEAARKKDDEVAHQLRTLTAEHRATILKIHEREQVIATKELEIEHLLAKNRDAAAKTEDVDALQAELAQRHAKIMELQTENRAQVVQIESLKEHRTRSDLSDHEDIQPAANITTRVEPVGLGPASQSTPAHMEKLLKAMEHENHWLRQREFKDQLDRNLRHISEAMAFDAEMKLYRSGQHPQTLALLEACMLTDDDSDSSATLPSPASPVQEAMTPLGLRAVQLGWESRTDSLKEAFEASEELMLETIYEEEELSFIRP